MNKEILTKRKIKNKVHDFLINATPEEQEAYLSSVLLLLSDRKLNLKEEYYIEKLEKDYDFSFPPNVIQNAKASLLKKNTKNNLFSLKENTRA